LGREIVGSIVRRNLVLAGLVVAFGAASCRDKRDDGTAPVAAGELPALVFGEDTPNLMLTWIDERGGTHVEVTPSDVPTSGRKLVRVLVAEREEGTRDPIYVADLDSPGAGGRFEARSLARADWEKEIERRRDAWAAEIAPPPPPAALAPRGPTGAPGPAPPRETAKNPLPDGVTVIVYGAEWCKPCHEAEAWLKARKIPVVLKDVDKSPEADFEMHEKLAKSGRRQGSIPVIDVAGKILVGFNPSALEKAIASTAGGTML
jgi:glutaredoxin